MGIMSRLNNYIIRGKLYKPFYHSKKVTNNNGNGRGSGIFR